MTRHGLGRGDVQLISCVTKYLLDGFCLRDITNVGGGTMNIDVVNILGLHTSILQGILHHQFGT